MAIDLTGIHNVGEFYSHHYLDSLLENDLKGLFASWKQEDDDTPDKCIDRLATVFFAAKRKAIQTNLERVQHESSHGIHVKLLEALGYEYTFETRYLLEGQIVPVLSVVHRDGQEYLWVVETQYPEEDQSPLGHQLSEYQFPKQEEEIKVPEETWEELLREIFRKDDPPRWVLLFAGRFVYLIDRTKWGYGQYLMFDLDEIFGRRQRETIRALAALISKEGIAPDDGVPLHFSLDENSHKHAFGVSKDLKYGLRRAVELLANEYVWYQRNVGKQAIFQDDDLAKKLTNEALSYLYRLLFLFYAEARAAELNIVPMKSEAYQSGYSVEMLRDLEQVPLNTSQAQNGYYINNSLDKLFGLINDGYEPSQMALLTEQEGEQVFQEHGFTIQGLNSLLFDRGKTPLLSQVKFRNLILQEIIQLLSLSREKNSSKYGRGRISYAQLGINQLGAVYEGLLSYTGFFAQETLYEVKPADVKESDEMEQTYFIPGDQLDRYEPEEFIYIEAPDSTKQRKSYPKGAFIFRLAGRDREKSASYYTPEVLTECVVKYSLKELLKGKTADEILKLTICEPAMGSGAFINEAVNQLAEAYLELKQQELGEWIPADEYRHERQKVKYYIATNNAYGVDLNPTAVELAKVSLWLNIIFDGAKVPWFGPRLAVGNSLIGARRQVYTGGDVLSGDYKKKAPEPVPLGDGEGNFATRPEGTVYHWLLPDEGMAAFDKDKVIKELAPKEVQAIKDWRKDFTKKITKTELKNLQSLSDQADILWQAHLHERQMILSRTKESNNIWGQKKPERASNNLSIEGKEKELNYINRDNSPFHRLKIAMDYWCALWFWPIKDAENLPKRQVFWNELNEIFKGVESDFIKPPEQLNIWGEDNLPKVNISEMVTPSIQMLTSTYPRLNIVYEISRASAFNHWELIFSDAFYERSGFDLLLGNPPWVLPEFKEANIFADFYPLIELRKFSSTKVDSMRSSYMDSTIENIYFNEFVSLTGFKSYTGSTTNYYQLEGKVNSYKCFIIISWMLGRQEGVVGLLHPEGAYDNPKGGLLRREIYYRIVNHFQFQNELKLFSEIGNRVRYSINIYRCKEEVKISFNHVSNLFHPITLEECFSHDGRGIVPGIKDDFNNWEIRGHLSRIIQVKESDLKVFVTVFDEPGTEFSKARLPLIHSRELLSIISKFSVQPYRLGDFHESYFSTPSTFWNETMAQQNGYIKRETHFPEKLENLIFSGPHFFIGTPFYQTPNENCNSHRDYSKIDLLTMPENFLPRSNYILSAPPGIIESKIPVWKNKKITKNYRHVNRGQLSQSGKRTLVNAIIPPNTSHIHSVFSISFESNDLLTLFSGLCSSLPYDFFVKATGKGGMVNNLTKLLPIPQNKILANSINIRTLRLNCLTSHYSALWEDLFLDEYRTESWSIDDQRLSTWNSLSKVWSKEVPLRNDFERRQALIEIDILVSLAIGLDFEELLTIYFTQFPVLFAEDKKLIFDNRGMKVPIKTIHGELVINDAHESFTEMEPPFTPVDREMNYRQAWAFFNQRFKEDNQNE